MESSGWPYWQSKTVTPQGYAQRLWQHFSEWLSLTPTLSGTPFFGLCQQYYAEEDMHTERNKQDGIVDESTLSSECSFTHNCMTNTKMGGEINTWMSTTHFLTCPRQRVQWDIAHLFSTSMQHLEATCDSFVDWVAIKMWPDHLRPSFMHGLNKKVQKKHTISTPHSYTHHQVKREGSKQTFTKIQPFFLNTNTESR